MKLIEALKQIQDLQRKASDLRDLAKTHCAMSSLETNKYPDQKKKVEGWIQSHFDILKEILRLRVAIQKTNLETKVGIEIGGKAVKKSIAEWIHRRRDLAGIELLMWNGLGDRGIKEGEGKAPSGDIVKIEIVRFYDPSQKDKNVDAFQSEPMIIDSRLEVVNALTDLIE